MRALTCLLFLALCLFACKPKTDEPSARQPKQYSIEQFYNNISIRGGAFAPDETKLLISSNESGIFNLYEIGIANDSRRQLSKSTLESFFAIDYVPGSNQILYTADQGGNEINHLYLLQSDGSVQDLTPGEKEKAQFWGWSEDKKAMYYLSNKRDPRYFDLYKMDLAKWEAKVLYQNDRGYEVSGLSWDEKTVALQENVTTSENRLYLHDLSSKQNREISKSKGQYDAAVFGKDGRSFYYLSNADREYQALYRYDLVKHSSELAYETNWDVMYSFFSEHEKYRVIGINEDGKNTLKIFETATNQAISMPDIPDGDILAVTISPSEKMMRLTVGTSKAPSNIYVYNFENKELKKLTETLSPELNPQDLVSAEVLRYPSFDGLEIPAIYYRPLQASAENKAPALVWVHGGPGGQSRIGYTPLIQYLVNHGYAVLAVNNRGSSGYGRKFYQMDDKNHGEKDLMDCIYGKKYLQSLAYIDSSKIGIIGGSYGGYMTMAAMTFQPQAFKVGVNIFGVTNWLRTLRSIPPYWEANRKALYAELGDPNGADSARLRRISPLFHAQQVQNPIMVLQGANDPRVLQVESDEIVAGVQRNKVPVEYIVFPDEGHGFVKKENEIKGYGAILTFLDKNLKKQKPLKN
jgi:dipeptidyl aminopeptidase/acylaminoacyl peptidase